MTTSRLVGFTVGVTADRRRHEQAALFERVGAQVLLGPATVCPPGGTLVERPRWAHPVDGGPARRMVAAICRTQVDAVTFTSDAAVANLFALADTLGQRDRLRHALAGPVVAATLGPAATAAARALGVARPAEASLPTLPSLADAVGEILGRRRHRLQVAGTELTVQGAMVQVDGATVELTPRERSLLEALCRQAGTVVARSALVRDLWAGDGAASHTVDVTVARLRRRLGPAGAAIRTVPRRGYWLDAVVA